MNRFSPNFLLLLKLFITFYGFIGLPILFEKKKKSDQKKGPNLTLIGKWLWTLLFNFTILYQLAFENPFLLESDIDVLTVKPLSQFLYYFNSVILHLVTHTILLVYYHLYAGQLVGELKNHLLNSNIKFFNKKEVRHKSQNKSKNAYKLFCIFLLLSNIAFLLGYYTLLKDYARQGFNHPRQLLNLLTAYVNFFYFLAPLFTVHLVEFTSFTQVKSVLKEAFSTKLQFCNNQKVDKSISLLAKIAAQHHRLLQLNSTPLCVVIAANTVDSLVALALSEQKIDYSYLFYVVSIFGYLLVAVHYTERTGQLFFSRRYLRNRVLKKNTRRKSCYFYISGEEMVVHFKLTGLPVYRDYFNLKVFNLCSLSYAWTFQLMLFILNNVLLIRQTKV